MFTADFDPQGYAQQHKVNCRIRSVFVFGLSLFSSIWRHERHKRLWDSNLNSDRPWRNSLKPGMMYQTNRALTFTSATNTTCWSHVTRANVCTHFLFCWIITGRTIQTQYCVSIIYRLGDYNPLPCSPWQQLVASKMHHVWYGVN